MICLIAYFFLLLLCSPSHTSENPPRPNNFNLLNPSGNLSPNIYISSRLRSYWLFFFFYHFSSIFSIESSLYLSTYSFLLLSLSGRTFGVSSLWISLSALASSPMGFLTVLFKSCLAVELNLFLWPSYRFYRLSETYFSKAVFLIPDR